MDKHNLVNAINDFFRINGYTLPSYEIDNATTHAELVEFLESVDASALEIKLEAKKLIDLLTEYVLSLKVYDFHSLPDVYKGNVRTCSGCEKLFVRNNLNFTRDCHGVVFRLACPTCYPKMMANGYDGEAY